MSTVVVLFSDVRVCVCVCVCVTVCNRSVSDMPHPHQSLANTPSSNTDKYIQCKYVSSTIPVIFIIKHHSKHAVSHATLGSQEHIRQLAKPRTQAPIRFFTAICKATSYAGVDWHIGSELNMSCECEKTGSAASNTIEQHQPYRLQSLIDGQGCCIVCAR